MKFILMLSGYELGTPRTNTLYITWNIHGGDHLRVKLLSYRRLNFPLRKFPI